MLIARVFVVESQVSLMHFTLQQAVSHFKTIISIKIHFVNEVFIQIIRSFCRIYFNKFVIVNNLAFKKSFSIDRQLNFGYYHSKQSRVMKKTGYCDAETE